MPGLYGTAPSWAWHGDDGNKFANSFFANTFYAAPYGKGDTIGCGVIYQDGVDGIIFYTRNGEALGMMIPLAFFCKKLTFDEGLLSRKT